MGLIILPFLIGALALVIIAMKSTLGLINAEVIGIPEIGLGLLISSLLFFAITISYIIERKIWGLSPYFRIPLITIFIPFAIHLGIKLIGFPNFSYFSSLILVSISISGILGMVFNYFLFRILKYFGIEKHY